MAAILDAIIGDAWPANRAAIVAVAEAEATSWRRRAFAAQMVAEAAGYFGDVETCNAMIACAVDAGTFDLLWLERCPVIEAVRATPARTPTRGCAWPDAPTRSSTRCMATTTTANSR